MEYIAAIIFFSVVIGGLLFLRSKKTQISNPVKGGGSTIPEGEGETDGSVTPPNSGPMAE